jgi:hypothetical protein
MSSVLLRTTLALGLSALTAPAFAAADFAACFTLTPGSAWSNGEETIRIAATPFGAHADAIGVTTSAGGVRSTEFFDASGRQQLGKIRYGIAAFGADDSAPIMTDTYTTVPTFPATARPGDRISLSGKGERINHAQDTTIALDYEGFADYTFVGFEDLEVEIDYVPRTFANTCHLTATVEGGRAEVWYAPGLGRIKFERYSGDMLLIGDEISSIDAD